MFTSFEFSHLKLEMSGRGGGDGDRFGASFYNVKPFYAKSESSKTLLKERLSTVDLIIKIGCFVKKENRVSV
jgi:hypothetical protein